VTQRSIDQLPPPLRQALERKGFEELTQVQVAALEGDQEARDLQISSQTGSGKTVALGLVMAPALIEAASSAPIALVIVPTRELAAQVRDELHWLYAELDGVRVESVTGGTNIAHERQRLKQQPRVLVGTPGRLLDHLRSGSLSLEGVRELVLDEADQMLDMGFREELEAILDATPTERRTHLVSATFPPAILRLAERYQRDPVQVQGTELGVANDDIEHIAFPVGSRERYAALVNLLLFAGEDRTLVFVGTRAETTLLADRLSNDGFQALPLSGELMQSQRTRTLAAFKQGVVKVLVATDVASRGLDVPDVATVIHTSPCQDREVYIHRSGRTGRAGKKGRSLSMVPFRQEKRVRWMLDSAGIPVQWRPVPSADEVRKLTEKRARRAVWEAVAGANEPSEDRVAQAQRLLAEYEPDQLVARLIELTSASKQPEAQELEAPSSDRRHAREPRHGRARESYGSHQRAPHGHASKSGGPHAGEPHGDRGYEPRGDGVREQHAGYGERHASHGERHASHGEQRANHGERHGGHVGERHGGDAGSERFTINWGAGNGASPKRLLAHICRRGGIKGSDVGAIRIQPQFSTFEVSRRVAKQFAGKARRRDHRDPRLQIRPAHGGAHRLKHKLARA